MSFSSLGRQQQHGGKLHRTLRELVHKVLKAAGVEDGHPHRFRDTFAKALLVKGVSIRTVSLLLGHTSIKTTEKHYAAFVPEYQEALDNATALLDFDAVA